LQINAIASTYFIMTMPSEITVQTWIWLVRAYGAAISDIEQALIDKGLPPLSWYDVLLELERAEDTGMRQFELEQALLLKQYSVSRLVERIGKEGYLRREPCISDGRGKRLMLTGSGKELRQRMWLIYGPKMQEVVGQKLTQNQCTELGGLLEKLVNKT
jgi:DNA-binding MarR family transcriptional regulator